MIAANELRTSNWILLDKDGGQIPYLVTSHDIEEIESYGEDCHPIPLTPEILEKAGFEYYIHNGIASLGDIKKDGDTHEWSLPAQRTDGHDIGSSFSIIRWGNESEPFYFSSHKIRIHIQYLHQLQNLYYALTGEELNIQL